MQKFLKNWKNKTTGRIRSLKLIYTLNNIINRNALKRNKAIYSKFGIKKSIFRSIGKEDLLKVKEPLPWLDQIDAMQNLESDSDFKAMNPEMQKKCKQFVREGFMILEGFYSSNEVSKFNSEIQSLIKAKKIDFNYTGKKLMQAHQYSEFIDSRFFRDKELLSLFQFLLGKKIIPFHTINFIEGSEQKAHSDSIHMSTAPEGYMIAAWVALEPTDKSNGPLFYYPGSHRLPYISCLDYNSGNSKYLIGENSYRNYEARIDQVIKDSNLNKQYFYANAGDVLIWHSNLLHGGDPILEKGRTRKSMVGHFFTEDVLCYHEISQRPAILDVNE